MNRFINTWEKVNNWIDKVLLTCASAIIAFVMLCISMEGILRNTTHTTRGWMEEFPRLFVVIAVFFLLGPLYRKGLHINTDMVDVLLKGRIKTVLAMIVHLSVIAGGIILLWAGIAGVLGFQQMGTISATEIELPIWTLYLAVPLGSAVLIIDALEAVCKTALLLKNGREIAQ